MPVSTTQIPQVSTNDSYSDWLTSSNSSFSRIYDVAVLLNEVETNVGSLATLNTTDKSSIVSALNELYDEFTTGTLLSGYIGTLGTLTTTNKSTIVAAVNELDNDLGGLSTLVTTDKTSAVSAINEVAIKVVDVGDLNNLLTIDKTSSVDAINELLSYIGTITNLSTTASDITNAINEHDSEIGVLSTMSTTDKSSVVAAINELVSGLTTYLKLDGSNYPSANIPWNNNRITGLGNGITDSDAVAYGQVQGLSGVGVLSTLVTTDKSDAVSAINETYGYAVKRSNSSSSEAAILPGGTTAQRPVTPTNGMFRYNSDTNGFEGYAGGWVPAVAASIPDATETIKGKSELATSSEALTGTDTTRAVTPSGLKAHVDNRIATTSVKGMSEIATSSEVNAGTDPERYVTPDTLESLGGTTLASIKTSLDIPGAVPSASTSTKGKVELATTSEAQAGTDGSRAVTAAGVKAYVDNASSGLGEGQSWQSVSRGWNTGYQNTTGKTIAVAITIANSSGGDTRGYLDVSTNNSSWIRVSETLEVAYGYQSTLHAIVPAGHYYRVVKGSGGSSANTGISYSRELR